MGQFDDDEPLSLPRKMEPSSQRLAQVLRTNVGNGQNITKRANLAHSHDLSFPSICGLARPYARLLPSIHIWRHDAIYRQDWPKDTTLAVALK